MQRRIKLVIFVLTVTVMMAGCAKESSGKSGEQAKAPEKMVELTEDRTRIVLSDEEIQVDNEVISTDSASAVYVGEDIVYYEEGKDETYGEGGAEDAHSREEAKAHKVVTITKPGTYEVSGSISAGQIAVDLGDEAEDNPKAVVNLILNNAEITCSVAPSILKGEADVDASASFMGSCMITSAPIIIRTPKSLLFPFISFQPH